MPVVRTYIVTQERQVKVSAENPADAVEIASALFQGFDPEKYDYEPSRVVSEIQNMAISARREI